MPITRERRTGGMRTVYSGFLGTDEGYALYQLYRDAASLPHRTAEAVLASPVRAASAGVAGLQWLGNQVPFGGFVTWTGYVITVPADWFVASSDAWRVRQADMANVVQDIIDASDREDFLRRINARVGYVFRSITREGAARAVSDLSAIELQVISQRRRLAEVSRRADERDRQAVPGQQFQPPRQVGSAALSQPYVQVVPVAPVPVPVPPSQIVPPTPQVVPPPQDYGRRLSGFGDPRFPAFVPPSQIVPPTSQVITPLQDYGRPRSNFDNAFSQAVPQSARAVLPAFDFALPVPPAPPSQVVPQPMPVPPQPPMIVPPLLVPAPQPVPVPPQAWSAGTVPAFGLPIPSVVELQPPRIVPPVVPGEPHWEDLEILREREERLLEYLRRTLPPALTVDPPSQTVSPPSQIVPPSDSPEPPLIVPPWDPFRAIRGSE